MKFKTTLFKAVNATEIICVNGSTVERCTTDLVGDFEVLTLCRGQILFDKRCLDQTIEIGQYGNAEVKTVDNEVVDIAFLNFIALKKGDIK